MKKKGIRFIHAALTGLRPLKRPIRLSDGQHLHYDFLVLCTGPALAFEEVRGAGPTRRAAPPASAPSPTQRSACTVSTGCSTNRVR